MAQVHIVYLKLVKVGSDGSVINTGGMTTPNPNPTESEMVSSPVRVPSFTTEQRVMNNSNVPNSDGWPDIETYLMAEAAAGFTLSHIDQTMIITTHP
jgi:hypothetical protein